MEPVTPTDVAAPVEVTPAADEPTTPAPLTGEEDSLGEGGKRALDAERRARRAADKQTAELSARLKEIEDRDKSETERLADRLKDAEAEASVLKSEAIKLRVAAEVGLPNELTEFLSAGDEETVRAQAEKLLAATAARRGTPAPDPTQGAKPAGGISQLSEADLAGMSTEAIVKAKSEGRFNDLLGIRS